MIRILSEEELNIASGLSRYVFDICLRNRMEFPQTIAFVEAYIAEENLKNLCQEGRLYVWGAFEGEELVAVAGLQSDGMITMLYVLPQAQNKGLGGKLLQTMREYANKSLHLSKVSVNANPAWTSIYFGKKGFINFEAKQNLHVPFVSMYTSTESTEVFEKRHVSKKVIAFAIIGSVLFATISGCLFMISYLF